MSHVPDPPAPDPNIAAVHHAGLDPAHAQWLLQVATLVDGRLAAVRRDWQQLPDSEALRAATYGLLLALLARRYPASRDVLSRVAEVHPSYGTLPASRRLATLEQLCSSGDLVAQWIGPSLGIEDAERLLPLYAFGSDNSSQADSQYNHGNPG